MQIKIESRRTTNVADNEKHGCVINKTRRAREWGTGQK